MKTFKKVLFLDMDGVIHNDASYMKYGQMIDIGGVKIISKLILEQDIGIVFSSTWRLGLDRDVVSDYLKLCGFPPSVLHQDYKTRDLIGEHRGSLIQEWLDAHPEVEQYVILDDDDDMLPSQKENFIHVDGMNGFGVRDFYRAESIFKGYRTGQCKEHINMGRK